ncbi:hypothetical protein [Streptomyces telluris]|uniref:Uncharacterized protein n=1 Tax=Streptomyces telluris TaxID=2720021 RepID=A0A9X2LPQ6_9ACTN|nr:hypothetical protein [Streptomyces telluris]MCQ8774817.1 hypothetical protein [Streptomyces telluris]NJP82493.1 hypothetical protein [Streptomyces telluris]
MGSSPFSGRRLADLADLRALATGEPHQLARAEIAAHAALIPSPSAGQARWEAAVLSALLAEFGPHRPGETGGPYGIVRVTPRQDEVLLRVDRAQLDAWARALVPRQHADGTIAGVAGLRWAARGKDVLLRPAHGPGQVVLSRTFESQWARAARTATGHDQAWAGDDGDAPVTDAERAAAEHQSVVTEGATVLSAVLRRIALVTELATLPFQDGRVDLQLTPGTGRFVDCSTGRPRLAAPWTTLHAPRRLWPDERPASTCRVPGAGAAVSAFLARYPWPPPPRPP